MSLDQNTVAERYAKAMIELAEADDQLDQTYQELVALRTIFTDNPSLQSAFSGTKLKLDQKQGLVDELKQGASKYVANLVQMVYDYGRMNDMVAIIDEFERQYDEKKKYVHAVVVTAVQLDETRRANLKNALAKRYGANQIILDEQVDPDIIGGAVIKIGSETLDGSVATKLNKMRRLLVG